MADQFLSQDEVDALLEGVTGESQKLEKDEQTGGIRNYDIASQERIVRGRMPTLEIINERFARNLRNTCQATSSGSHASKWKET